MQILSNSLVKILLITNINRELKSIKSDILANFILINYYNIIIATNKVVAPFDLGVIGKYIKNINNIKQDDISTLWLPQFKSYLKITDILYLMENTNILSTLVLLKPSSKAHISSMI